MFCQLAPPSREMWTKPSSEPAQKTPFSWGDSRNEKTVQYVSAPDASPVMSPPEGWSLSGSLRVRSGLMGSQLLPWSVERNTTFPAT